jgi:putative ABC transport system permease protein
MLAIPGAALGLLLAVPALRAIDSAVPSEIYRVGALAIDLPTALFTAALSVLAAVLAGLAPAVRLTGLQLLTTRDMVSVHQTRATRLFHNALVVVQVALAIVLAGCAALTWQSVVVLRQLDPGFRAAGVTTALIVLPRSEYTDPARVRAFQDAVLDQLARAPGVRSTAIVNFLPLNHETNLNEVRVAGHEEPGRSLRALTLHASDRYFETMGIPLLRGRSFDATDAGASDLRVVVSASMAGRFWKDGDALGRTFQVATGPGTYRDASVIGIVGDSAQDDLGRPAPWQLYASTRQASVRYFRVLVRSEAAAAVTQSIRAAVARADSSVAVAEVRSLAAVVNEYLLPQRAITAMLLTLACVALVLAIVGLHGLLAFFVSQHARDIGIRVALGAEPRHVTALVLGRTAILVAIGFAAGAAMVATAGQLLGSFLYGVTTADPATFGSLAALFGGVAFVAAVRPLRRALRIDPADSLRVVL